MTQPEDLSAVVSVTGLALAPDGSRLAVSTAEPDIVGNAYRHEIALFNRTSNGWTAAGVPRIGGSGAVFSPDGTELAYVERDAPEAAHVVVLDLGSRSARRVLSWPEVVGDLAWSPGGRHLGFVARQRIAPRGVLYADRADPPRVVRHLQYRSDTVGWTCDRPRHCFAVDVREVSPPVNLSGDRADDSCLVWLGEAEYAFVSRRHLGAELDIVSDVFLGSVDWSSGERNLRQLTATDRQWGPLATVPGAGALYGRYARVREFPCHERVARLDTATGAVVELAPGYDRSMTGALEVRVDPVSGRRELCTLAASEGRVDLVTVTDSGSLDGAVTVAPGQRSAKAFAVAGQTVVLAAAAGARPVEVYEVLGSALSQVTAFHDRYTTEVGSVEPTYVGATADDGTAIDCWVLRPPPGRPVVGAVLYIPGGGGQFGYDYHHDMQVLASSGIAVIFGNARGSGGYGEDWARAVCGPRSRFGGTGWCGVDGTDMLAIVGAALRSLPDVEPSRVAVMGGSYGGLMSAYLGFTTDVFAAIVAERGPYNLEAMAATSDEGSWFFDAYIGATVAEDPEQYRRSSVMSYVDQVSAPVLILHSEQDLRCPVQQAEELFTALRRRDHDVTFVRFPDESHELSRSGSPVHRVQRSQVIRDWLLARLSGSVAAFEAESPGI